MPRLIPLALAVALAACTHGPAPQGTFRDTGQPIYSNATLGLARLTGTWTQAAGFGAPCAPGTVRFQADGTLQARLCLNGAIATASGSVTPTGPGRFRIAGATGPLAQDWWVLWIDVDDRTMAIGTPSGDFGFVLNRNGPLPEDRFAAAAELFDFNGYSVNLLNRLH